MTMYYGRVLREVLRSTEIAKYLILWNKIVKHDLQHEVIVGFVNAYQSLEIRLVQHSQSIVLPVVNNALLHL
jgi:hypothetical protein